MAATILAAGGQDLKRLNTSSMTQTFPQSVEVKVLDTLHTDVKANTEVCDQLRVLHAGGQELKLNASRFLKKHSKELGTAYQSRLERLTYDNILGTICSYYSSRLFENDLEFDFKADGVDKLPPKINDYYSNFLKNCDLCGTSLERFFEQVSDEILIYGRSYFLIDLPRLATPPATLAEQEALRRIVAISGSCECGPDLQLPA